MDMVKHFEITASDMKRAGKFYEKAFCWKVTHMPKYGYTSMQTAPIGKNLMTTEKGAINGGMIKRKGKVKSPIIMMVVKNIEASLKKIKAAGGKAVAPIFEVPGAGRGCYFADSEGNVLGIWQEPKK